jgi:hypothetical protein
VGVLVIIAARAAPAGPIMLLANSLTFTRVSLFASDARGGGGGADTKDVRAAILAQPILKGASGLFYGNIEFISPSQSTLMGRHRRIHAAGSHKDACTMHFSMRSIRIVKNGIDK